MMSPSETTELMKNLRKLSEVDEQLASLTNQEKNLQDKITAVETEIETRKNEIEENLRKIKEDTHLEHKNESLLKETEEEVQKVQAQLNAAKTNEELKIFKKKREELENNISKLEDAILTRLNSLDSNREQTEQAKERLEEREKKSQNEILAIRNDISICEQEHSVLLEKRSAIASQVPPEALIKYERVLAKEKHNPVVEVKNQTCQGCFMRVTLQEINRIWHGNDLVFCRNCNRILCLPEDELQE